MGSKCTRTCLAKAFLSRETTKHTGVFGSSRLQVRLQVDSFFLDYATHRTKQQTSQAKEANNHQQTRTASDQGGWGMSTIDIAELGDERVEGRLWETSERSAYGGQGRRVLQEY